MTRRDHKRVGVILPVGPNDADGALDTLASALHYLDKSRIIVAVDDTGSGSGFSERVREFAPEIVVLPAPPRAPGGLGGLWVKIAAGYAWLLERYQPDIVLRLDADALIIGPGIESRAGEKFAADPRVGLLGSYRVCSDGSLRDWSWAARRLRVEAGIRGYRHPPLRSRLREFMALAALNGYVYGEHALGGCYIHSYAAVREIHAHGWFNEPTVASSKLGEDHIMALFTVAAGYRITDFGGPDDPMALLWRGLPAHPRELLFREKLITHSVRSWQNLKEQEIRDIFSVARASTGAPRSS